MDTWNGAKVSWWKWYSYCPAAKDMFVFPKPRCTAIVAAKTKSCNTENSWAIEFEAFQESGFVDLLQGTMWGFQKQATGLYGLPVT